LAQDCQFLRWATAFTGLFAGGGWQWHDKANMKRELKIAIADLQRAFNKSELTGLWVMFSAEGTSIGVTDAEGKTENFDLPPDAFDDEDD
jgi:hypothetical protein